MKMKVLSNDGTTALLNLTGDRSLDRYYHRADFLKIAPTEEEFLKLFPVGQSVEFEGETLPAEKIEVLSVQQVLCVVSNDGEVAVLNLTGNSNPDPEDRLVYRKNLNDGTCTKEEFFKTFVVGKWVITVPCPNGESLEEALDKEARKTQLGATWSQEHEDAASWDKSSG